MFTKYCAVCHGTEAKGNGPAAVALTKAPSDLTKISERNGGAFPEVKVGRYIEGLDEVASHGTRDMPMWGDVFKSLDTPDTAKRRIFTLVEYLRTLQTK
jgi:mono/diheme cytochrome c family protein